MNRAKFFTSVRSSLFGGKLENSEVAGCEAVINAFEAAGLTNPNWLAYMLATVFHECAGTMQPIGEYGKGKGREYGKPAGPFKQVYYGRGFVQLTWLDNYKRAEAELGQPFVEHPELALDPKHAADIMIKGMTQGWFTGKRLAQYFNSKNDPVNARRIINGTDKAVLIAGYYEKFLKAINEANAG